MTSPPTVFVRPQTLPLLLRVQPATPTGPSILPFEGPAEPLRLKAHMPNHFSRVPFLPRTFSFFSVPFLSSAYLLFLQRTFSSVPTDLAYPRIRPSSAHRETTGVRSNCWDTAAALTVRIRPFDPIEGWRHLTKLALQIGMTVTDGRTGGKTNQSKHSSR